MREKRHEKNNGPWPGVFFGGGGWFEQCLLEKDRRAKQKGGHFEELGSTFGRRSGSTPQPAC